MYHSKGPGYSLADTQVRLLEELCRPGALDRRREGDRQLLDYVETESRNLPPDAFSKLTGDIFTRVESMIKFRWCRHLVLLNVRLGPL